MRSQLGEKIRELRKKSGMTQHQLAQRLGISSSAVGMYEQGRREPDNKTLLELCSIFDISSDYLLGKDEPVESGVREVSDVFDEFTRILSSQQCLMFDGVPLDDEDRGKIVDAIKVVGAVIAQQQSSKRRTEGS